MSLETIPAEAKQMVDSAISKLNNDFVRRKMDELIHKWYHEFRNDDDTSFEDMYKSWELDAFFGNYTKQFQIPPIEEVEEAINDQGCRWERFNAYFQKHLTIKK